MQTTAELFSLVSRKLSSSSICPPVAINNKIRVQDLGLKNMDLKGKKRIDEGKMGLEWGRIRRNTVVPEVNIFWTPPNSLVVIHNIFLIYSVVVSDICARDYLRQEIFYPQQRQFSFICGIEYINKNFQQQTFKFNALLKTGLDIFFFFPNSN